MQVWHCYQVTMKNLTKMKTWMMYYKTGVTIMTPNMLQLNQAGRKLYIRSQDSSSCSSFFEFDKQEFANKEQVDKRQTRICKQRTNNKQEENCILGVKTHQAALHFLNSTNKNLQMKNKSSCFTNPRLYLKECFLKSSMKVQEMKG